MPTMWEKFWGSFWRLLFGAELSSFFAGIFTNYRELLIYKFLMKFCQQFDTFNILFVSSKTMQFY